VEGAQRCLRQPQALGNLPPTFKKSDFQNKTLRHIPPIDIMEYVRKFPRLNGSLRIVQSPEVVQATDMLMKCQKSTMESHNHPQTTEKANSRFIRFEKCHPRWSTAASRQTNRSTDREQGPIRSQAERPPTPPKCSRSTIVPRKRMRGSS